MADSYSAQWGGSWIRETEGMLKSNTRKQRWPLQCHSSPSLFIKGSLFSSSRDLAEPTIFSLVDRDASILTQFCIHTQAHIHEVVALTPDEASVEDL